MKFCLSLGKIGKNIIFPLISCMIIILEYSFLYKYIDNISSHKFVYLICQSLGKCLSIIPYIIQKRMSKNISKEILVKDNKLLYKKGYYEKYKNITLKKYFFLLINSIIKVTFNFFYFHIFLKVSEFSFWILNTILLTLFSYLILKEEIQSHHYLSITTIVILGIILNAINLYGKVEIGILDIIVNIIRDTIFSLNIVLKKYLIEYLFCSVYEILFYEGLFSLIIFIIFLSLSTNININSDSKICYVVYNDLCYVDNFFSYYNNLDRKEIFIFFLVMIYYLFYFLFCLLTIKHFNVFYYLIILLSEEKIMYNYDIETWKIFTNLVIFIIVFFMTLVFLEIIEFNCFGLQNNTKKSINERAQSEGINEIILNNVTNEEDDLDNSLLYI